MTATDSPTPTETPLAKPHRKRGTLILVVITALFVIVPFLFWRGTWFGMPLTEEKIGEYLADTKEPRHSQHALAQIAERIANADPTVKRWYPQVLRLVDSPYPELRVNVAWVLGADNQSEEFHQALLALLRDPEPLVRRNAALSLVRFGDSIARPELLSMIRPYTVVAPREGKLLYRLEEADSVDRGTLMARIEVARMEAGEEEPLEIRSPLPGKLQRKLAEEGALVEAEEQIILLSPGEEHAWEALRALYLVGQNEDLAEIERFARGAAGEMSPRVQQQAVLTVGEIRRRASENNRREVEERVQQKAGTATANQ
ncbi:MAG: HEAT repeat domain-containing protein [Acidobacteria bacterium]|nr:HEAT repeat domain-containing protein [Acidobacteriota bacterium]